MEYEQGGMEGSDRGKLMVSQLDLHYWKEEDIDFCGQILFEYTPTPFYHSFTDSLTSSTNYSAHSPLSLTPVSIWTVNNTHRGQS